MLPSFQVSHSLSFWVLEFRSFWFSEFQGIWLRCQVTEFPSFQVSKFPGSKLKAYKLTSYQVPIHHSQGDWLIKEDLEKMLAMCGTTNDIRHTDRFWNLETVVFKKKYQRISNWLEIQPLQNGFIHHSSKIIFLIKINIKKWLMIRLFSIGLKSSQCFKNELLPKTIKQCKILIGGPPCLACQMPSLDFS